jgi:hypothetical protein
MKRDFYLKTRDFCLATRDFHHMKRIRTTQYLATLGKVHKYGPDGFGSHRRTSVQVLAHHAASMVTSMEVERKQAHISR